jgi:hypothetical protein
MLSSFLPIPRIPWSSSRRVVLALACGFGILLPSVSADAARRDLSYAFEKGRVTTFSLASTRSVVTEVVLVPEEANQLEVDRVLGRIAAVESQLEGRLERFVAKTYRDGTLGLVTRLVDLTGTVTRGGVSTPDSFAGLDGKSLALRLRGSGELLDSQGWSQFMGGGRGGELAQDVLLQSVLRLPRHLPSSEGIATSFTIRLPLDAGLETRVAWTVRYFPAEATEPCPGDCVAITYQGELREEAHDKAEGRTMSRVATGTVEGTVVLTGKGARRALSSHRWKLVWDRDIASYRADGDRRGRLRQQVTSTGQLERIGGQEPVAGRSPLTSAGTGTAVDRLDSPGEATDRYLSPDEVRLVLHAATDDFTGCFVGSLVGADAPLNAAVTFVVSRSGETQDLQVTLGSNEAALRACLGKVVEGLSFDDHDGDPLEVSYPLVFVADEPSGRVLPYPVVFTKTQPVRLPLLELPPDLSSAELLLLEWLFTEKAPTPVPPE